MRQYNCRGLSPNKSSWNLFCLFLLQQKVLELILPTFGRQTSCWNLFCLCSDRGFVGFSYGWWYDEMMIVHWKTLSAKYYFCKVFRGAINLNSDSSGIRYISFLTLNSSSINKTFHRHSNLHKLKLESELEFNSNWNLLAIRMNSFLTLNLNWIDRNLIWIQIQICSEFQF